MELSGSDPVVETPETPTPETPAVEATESPVPETPAAPVIEEPLYDLPDGRKVDAATLQREWKENFLPDYTRKSQKIAEIERSNKDIIPPKDEPAWKNPDYVPKDYAELIDIATREAEDRIRGSFQKEQERLSAVQTAVENEIKELKGTDPTLDEAALFQHANKYGFQNLKAAHKNMSDMKAVSIEVEQRTLKNIKTREADPVSTGAAPGATVDDGYDPLEMSQFRSANEYLARIKGNK